MLLAILHQVARSNGSLAGRGVGQLVKGSVMYECNVCKGDGWVCERHPTKPWSDVGCKCGAGVPCECNKSNPPRVHFDEVYADVDISMDVN